MSGDLTKTIRQLRSLSPKLNEAADKATEVVEAVEQFLTEECSIGLPAAIVVSSEAQAEEDEDGEVNVKATITKEVTLVYERIGGTFGIGIKVADWRKADPDDLGNREDITTVISLNPWSACPRNLRLAAFQYLPDLLKEIASDAEAAIKESQEATETVTTILDALVAGKGDTNV